MKKTIILSFSLFFLYFLISYPQEALNASREGMKLWLNTLIPTLLPFLILTNFLIYTDEIEKFFQPFYKAGRLLLGLSPSGIYALFLGMLCGYPMGAKITSDLYQNHKISQKEAYYLLTFCNQASPAFLITYLAHICLKSQIPVHRILLIVLLSNIITMLLFRFTMFRGNTIDNTRKKGTYSKKETSLVSSFGTLLDVSIMNGFETITRLGGYILLFSIISAMISHYWKFSSLSKLCILGALEITTGLFQLSTFPLPLRNKFLLSMCMISFGGICITAQTRSILHKSLSIKPYLCAKIINAVVTGIIILVFTKVI